MDPFSHGLLGASAALTRAPKDKIAAAIICGILGGMAPDLDILIRSDVRPLLQIEYHRHFTHALAFVPIGGLLVAMGLWPILRRHISFVWIWMFTTLGYATHGLLDAMTNYGTHLAWPFSLSRVSWSIVSVVDPIVTIFLMAAVIGTYCTNSKKWLYSGLALAFLYWGFGALQHDRAWNAMQQLARDRGHIIAAHEVKPTLFNNIIWRTNYISTGIIYNDGWHIGPFGNLVHYPGGAVSALDMMRDFPTIPADSVAGRDIAKFAFFSAGFVGVKPDDAAVIGDFRFALLPDDTGPLWGIRIDSSNSQRAVEFESYRNVTPNTWRKFWIMLRGESLHLHANDAVRAADKEN